ncbi:glycosyltransferase family 4 protein [Anaerophilus nitritogenes]|uniref:glycosyltransferase family 4 protein n=1 Tax=Anaerophilus nitritogenes TaxID=2498136 RepID=UPI0013ED6446|nr:glycosyltransferase family 1 protein [Anaerophilus nitritogenes]
MKIGIDGRLINGSGIGTYISNLIKQYEKKNIDVNVYCKEDQSQKMITEFGVNTEILDANIYGLKEQMKAIKAIADTEHDIIHWPHYNIPLLYKGPLVVTIHDIIHLKFPEFLPNKAAYYYAYFMFRQVIQKANRIIVDSRNTKLDLLETFKVEKSKIQVIYLGVDDLFKNIQINTKDIDRIKYKYKIHKPYILYIGNVRAHKNIDRLIKSYKKLRQMTNKYKLVIIGEEHKNLKNVDMDNEILMLGYVDRKDLSILYAAASLFVFPSLYEGFGLPPLEAMASGTPVITSNVSSLPEVVGDAAIQINPYDIDQLTMSMYNVLVNEELSKKLVDKGFQRIKLFDWKKTANETLKVYEQVLREIHK